MFHKCHEGLDKKAKMWYDICTIGGLEMALFPMTILFAFLVAFVAFAAASVDEWLLPLIGLVLEKVCGVFDA